MEGKMGLRELLKKKRDLMEIFDYFSDLNTNFSQFGKGLEDLLESLSCENKTASISITIFLQKILFFLQNPETLSTMTSSPSPLSGSQSSPSILSLGKEKLTRHPFPATTGIPRSPSGAMAPAPKTPPHHHQKQSFASLASKAISSTAVTSLKEVPFPGFAPPAPPPEMEPLPARKKKLKFSFAKPRRNSVTSGSVFSSQPAASLPALGTPPSPIRNPPSNSLPSLLNLSPGASFPNEPVSLPPLEEKVQEKPKEKTPKGKPHSKKIERRRAPSFAAGTSPRDFSKESALSRESIFPKEASGPIQGQKPRPQLRKYKEFERNWSTGISLSKALENRRTDQNWSGIGKPLELENEDQSAQKIDDLEKEKLDVSFVFMWDRNRWSEIFYRVGLYRQFVSFTSEEISLLKMAFSNYVTQLPTISLSLSMTEKQTLKQMSFDFLSFLSSHHFDPLNSLYSRSVSLLSSGFICLGERRDWEEREKENLKARDSERERERGDTERKKDSERAREKEKEKKRERRQKEQEWEKEKEREREGVELLGRLEKEMGRWIALGKDHSSTIFEEMSSLFLSSLSPMFLIKNGDYVAVRSTSIPPPYRKWFTNEKWENEFGELYVLLRSATQVFRRNLPFKMEVFVDPTETITISLPLEDVFYLEREEQQDFVEKAKKFTKKTSSLLLDYFFQKSDWKSNSYEDSKITEYLDLFEARETAKKILKERTLSSFSSFSSFENTFKEFLDMAPLSFYLEPTLKELEHLATDWTQTLKPVLKERMKKQVSQLTSRLNNFSRYIQKAVDGEISQQICHLILQSVEETVDNDLREKGFNFSPAPFLSLSSVYSNLEHLKKKKEASRLIWCLTPFLSLYEKVRGLLSSLLFDLEFIVGGEWSEWPSITVAVQKKTQILSLESECELFKKVLGEARRKKKKKKKSKKGKGRKSGGDVRDSPNYLSLSLPVPPKEKEGLLFEVIKRLVNTRLCFLEAESHALLKYRVGVNDNLYPVEKEEGRCEKKEEEEIISSFLTFLFKNMKGGGSDLKENGDEEERLSDETTRDTRQKAVCFDSNKKEKLEDGGENFEYAKFHYQVLENISQGSHTLSCVNYWLVKKYKKNEHGEITVPHLLPHSSSDDDFGLFAHYPLIGAEGGRGRRGSEVSDEFFVGKKKADPREKRRASLDDEGGKIISQGKKLLRLAGKKTPTHPTIDGKISPKDGYEKGYEKTTLPHRDSKEKLTSPKRGRRFSVVTHHQHQKAVMSDLVPLARRYPKLSFTLRAHNNLFALKMFSVLAQTSPANPTFCQFLFWLIIHGHPTSLFLEYLKLEAEETREMTVLMRSSSLTSTVLANVHRLYSPSLEVQLSSVLKFASGISAKTCQLLLNSSSEHLQSIAPKHVSMKAKLKREIVSLFQAEHFPIYLCQLCRKTVKVVSGVKDLKMLDKVSVENWAVGAILFLRLVVPLISANSDDEKKIPGLRFLSRLLMKLCNNSVFPETENGCLANEVIAESLEVFDQFVLAVLDRGKIEGNFEFIADTSNCSFNDEQFLEEMKLLLMKKGVGVFHQCSSYEDFILLYSLVSDFYSELEKGEGTSLVRFEWTKEKEENGNWGEKLGDLFMNEVELNELVSKQDEKDLPQFWCQLGSVALSFGILTELLTGLTMAQIKENSAHELQPPATLFPPHSPFATVSAYLNNGICQSYSTNLLHSFFSYLQIEFPSLVESAHLLNQDEDSSTKEEIRRLVPTAFQMLVRLAIATIRDEFPEVVKRGVREVTKIIFEEYGEEMKNRLLVSFFCDWFLCLHLANPQSIGVEFSCKKVGMLMSKMLQTAGLDQEFDSKNMIFVNSILKEAQPLLHLLFLMLCDENLTKDDEILLKNCMEVLDEI